MIVWIVEMANMGDEFTVGVFSTEAKARDAIADVDWDAFIIPWEIDAPTKEDYMDASAGSMQVSAIRSRGGGE